MPPLSKWIRDVAPSDGVGKAARRTVKSRFGGLRRYLQRAATEHDLAVEDVHQLRVWTRRLDAALDFYRDVLPPRRRKKTTKLLKKVRQAAGPTRDLDVLIRRLLSESSDPRTARFLEEATAARQRAQQLTAEFSARVTAEKILERRLGQLLRSIRKQQRNASELISMRFGDWAKQRLRSYVKAFFQSEPPPNSSAEELHEFRIQGKQLRYTMELAASAFAPKFRKALYSEIAELQDILGRINDLTVAQERFRKQKDNTDDPELACYLDDAIRADQSRLDQALGDYQQFWTSQRRKRVKKQFRKLLAE